MLVPKPLILFIDAYDSFSNNIISLLETTLDASVRTVKIDDPALANEDALLEELKHYAAVICGPGPGDPANEQDVGIMRTIWRLGDESMLPVLGICLGFQSLCLEFGAEVRRLNGPQHGMVRHITHIGNDSASGHLTIFGGVGEVNATLYQSLCVDWGQDLIPREEWITRRWKPTKTCPDLLPLAWAESEIRDESDSGIRDERVLVAVQHSLKPFWALQYHPESICTNAESIKVIENWFIHAMKWNRVCRLNPIDFGGSIQGQYATRESLLSQYETSLRQSEYSDNIQRGDQAPNQPNICAYASIEIPNYITGSEILEALQDISKGVILLESSNSHETYVGMADVRGRYSIIGLDIDNCARFEYISGSSDITGLYPRGEDSMAKTCTLDQRSFGGIWPFLAQYLDRRRVLEGPLESPFWGGFMGYTTYELGLETIDVRSQGRHTQNHARPDLCFAWVERSVVIDHQKNIMYLQELSPQGSTDSTQWMLAMVETLKETLGTRGTSQEGYAIYPDTSSCRQDVFDKTSRVVQTVENYPLSEIQPNGHYVHANVDVKVGKRKPVITPQKSPTISSLVTQVTTPLNSEYENKVRVCQSEIRAGDSYELCLTDRTSVTLQKLPSWDLYRTLRNRQPAPFASYIRLGSTTLVSSSPERFLKWDSSGNCELRPMKGTIRKSAAVSTLAQAILLLDIPKEKAENLMIVDLVRHDLHGICGSGNVSVPRLMVVEEYKSVFQMISIVQGKIPAAIEEGMEVHLSATEKKKLEREKYSGIDVLASSLPPGSMTGAPKKRSCEILQAIEGGKERGLYSGVVGYMDVRGRGDWSVTIRCMFKWDDEDSTIVNSDGEKVETETWHIGAGGAVTSLSTPVGEREEMLTKLEGTLGVFR